MSIVWIEGIFMRRCSPEIEAVVSKINADCFTRDKSARELDLSPYEHLHMMELNGTWKIVGWAFADDVAPRDLCPYVIMCERNDEQMWCHISHYSLENIAEKVMRFMWKSVSRRIKVR